MKGFRFLVALVVLALLATPGFAQGGSKDNTPGPAIPRASGGPDDFGYLFVDSDEPDGPTFSFVDISTTADGSAALGDDDETPAPIGFDFNFYGTVQNTVNISSNGFISFDAGLGGDFSNDCPLIPGTSPTNMIAPYWDDMDPGDDGALVYWQTFATCPVFPPDSDAESCAVYQWNEFDFFPGDGTPGGTAGTWEAILYDDNQILYQYRSATLDGAGATVAISQDNAGNSLLYACDSAGDIGSGLAINYFVPPPPNPLDVPTLGETGFAALVLLLGAAAIFVMRRRG